MAAVDLELDGLEILSPAECWALLGEAKVGRVGVSLGALPAIFPVNYATAEDAVVFCTGPGIKLRAATANAVVAFEVDGFDEDAGTGWSVLVVGTCSETDDTTFLSDEARGRLRPWAGGGRDHVVRLSSEFVSGRRIVASAGRE
jgi:nitroimidazol reductase NimA-like FMN-containing flavoprotein (pyridoxamine 5'-phosphate oxidase superfamily)